MKTIHYFLLSLLTATLLFGTYACKDSTKTMARLTGFTSEALSHVPENAYSVGRININSLMDKSDFENMKNMEFYQEMISEAEEKGEVVADILRNPKNSGIDLGDYAYFFSSDRSDNGKNQFSGLVFKLNDAAQFEKLVAAKEDINIKTEEGYKYAKTGNKAVVGWTGNLAVVGGGEGRDLQSDLVTIFNTKRENSIANNSNLTDFLREEHDISLWMGSDAYAKRIYNSMQKQLILMGISQKDLKENYVNSYADFEDGAIVGHSAYMLKSALTKDLNMVFGNEVKTDFSKYMPGEGLGTALSFRMDFRGLQQLLKEKGFGGFINMGLSEYGLKTEDFGETFDGDVMIAAYDNGGEKSPSSLIMMNIKDDQHLSKFFELGEKMNILEKQGNNEYEIKGTAGALDKMLDKSKSPRRFKNGTSNAKLVVRDNMIFITDREDIFSKVKSGGYARSGQVKGTAANVLTGNIFGMYMDAAQMKGMSDDIDSRYIKDMQITTSNMKSNLLVQMLDKNQNSLKTFTEMINEQHKNGGMNIDFDEEKESL